MAIYRPERRILRASDAEREQVVERLRHHAGEGRLTVDELSDRVGVALSAKTLGELDDLVVDLPRPEPAAPLPVTGGHWRPNFLGAAVRLYLLGLLALLLVGAGDGRHHLGLLFWLVAFGVWRFARRARRFGRRPPLGPSRRFPLADAPHWTRR